jgi:hypothetical protein
MTPETRWLGHHSANFTLDTDVHLLDGDFGQPLEEAERDVILGNPHDDDPLCKDAPQGAQLAHVVADLS